MKNLYRLLIGGIFVTFAAAASICIWLDQAEKIKAYNLLAASSAGDRKVVVDLLREGLDVNSKFGGDGETALHRASAAGYAEITELLLKAKANPNIVDGDGATPLLAASYAGHTEIVKLLLTSGADPSKSEARYGMTPLILAAWKGHAATVKAGLPHLHVIRPISSFLN